MNLILNWYSRLLKTLGNKKDDPLDHIRLVNELSQDGGCHRISEVCLQMMRQLCVKNNVRQVQTKVNVVAEAPLGSVATKEEDLRATWVVLDRLLKNKADNCLNQLNCNIVIIDHGIARVLKSINSQSVERNDVFVHQNDSTMASMLEVYDLNSNSLITSSSFGFHSRSPRTDSSCSISSPEKYNVHKTTNLITNTQSSNTYVHQYTQFVHKNGTEAIEYPTSGTDINETPSKSSASPRKERIKSHSGPIKSDMNKVTRAKVPSTALVPSSRSTDAPRLQQNITSSTQSKQLVRRKQASEDWDVYGALISASSPIDRTSSIRKTMSVSIKQPLVPPPLCSICKHSAPIFGKPPRKFCYEEIELATEGFSRENFLAEGGYGLVYRGIMPDGQTVAVKQHKIASAQGASEFCAKVEVLSCAQHKNLVMLVGYCTEPEWLLVYEFACNGSLDKHLYESRGKENDEVMSWKNRMKVAIGAARGLRYLHEDCRVGCIVHRDLRPKNILLTHDYEPMVLI